MKEVEGTITAEEALRYTYKLIFKQDLKENREWGLFTEREGLMQMGRKPSDENLVTRNQTEILLENIIITASYFAHSLDLIW